MSDQLRQQIIEKLKTVHDPEIPINLYDLGLIYDININDNKAVDIQMTLTTPNCPVAESMPAMVHRAVQEVKGVESVNVDLVWEPAWSPDSMSEEAKMQLEMMGIDWKQPATNTGMASLTVNRQANTSNNKPQ